MALKGKFVKESNPDGSLNKEESSWIIFEDDNLVAEISVRRFIEVDRTQTYETIATRQFGQQLLVAFKKVPRVFR